MILFTHWNVARGSRMMKLSLPWPPSVNGYWRAFRGRQIISKKGREYRAAVIAQLGLSDIVFKAPSTVAVSVWAYPPDRRVRNIDNLFKGLLDALTHGKVWDDDNQADELHIYRRACMGKPGHVEVEIEEL